MLNPADESSGDVLRGDFDRRLMLQLRGLVVTSDAGLLAYREFDDALGLSAMAGKMLADARTGKNGQYALVGLMRQSVFGRLAGYEDVNDAGRLRHDPAMRPASAEALDRRRQSRRRMRGVGEPNGPLRNALAHRRQKSVGARRSFRPVDRPRACPASAEGRRARHGFKRQPHPWRTGKQRLEQALRLHLLSSIVLVQSVWRSGRIRPATRQCSQRRRLG